MRYFYNDDNPKVIKILQTISENPGVCYSVLLQKTGLQNGSLSNYLHHLEKDSKLLIVREKKRTWFFPKETDPQIIMPIIHLRKETASRILEFLLEKKEVNFSQIRNQIQKSPSTVSYTLTHLIEQGLIKRKSGFQVRYVLADEKSIRDSLEKINPSNLDLMKDRFADTFSYF